MMADDGGWVELHCGRTHLKGLDGQIGRTDCMHWVDQFRFNLMNWRGWIGLDELDGLDWL